MIETENFANFDADVDYGDLPIFFELRGITLFGNATNQASGMGIALCGASYTIVDVIVKGTKGIGFYSNGHRIPGTNYPIYGDEDNEYAPNCFIDRLKVYRANGDGVYYSGPADSIFGDVVVANGLARGFVVEPSALPDAGTAVFDMNYIHAFANVDCNIEISEGFSCQMLESRDGQAEALIVDTTRNFAVHGAYINNCDRNLTGVNCVTIKDGNAMISNAYIAGQAGGAQDVLVVEDGTPQLENLRIYSDAGTGKALDIQSPTFYAQVSNVSVNGFDPTTPNVTIAGNGHSIKQVNMNAAGCLQCTGTTCILDDIRVISPNDITTAQCIEMGGSLNQLSHAVVRSASNTYGILVSGNKTIINPATFYLFTGSQPIHVTGTNNKVHPGYDDFELITANGALNVTGDTHIDADAGALAVTLAAGGGLLYPHTKRIYMDPSSGNNAVLTFPATTLKDLTGTTKTSITFTAADQFVELEWTRTAWIIKTNYGTTVA